MKKIFQTILAIAFVSFLAGNASAQSQNNNPQPAVTYTPVNSAPAVSDTAASVSDNPDVAKPQSKEPQSLLAPEHAGNKTKEEAEKAAEKNKKKESEPKK